MRPTTVYYSPGLGLKRIGRCYSNILPCQSAIRRPGERILENGSQGHKGGYDPGSSVMSCHELTEPAHHSPWHSSSSAFQNAKSISLTSATHDQPDLLTVLVARFNGSSRQGHPLLHSLRQEYLAQGIVESSKRGLYRTLLRSRRLGRGHHRPLTPLQALHSPKSSLNQSQAAYSTRRYTLAEPRNHSDWMGTRLTSQTGTIFCTFTRLCLE